MHEWTSDTVSDFCAEQTALLLPKERRFKLSSAFLVRNDGNSHLISLDYVFASLDKSPDYAGFKEAERYDVSDRLEGKRFRIRRKIPKTLAKLKWDGKRGPTKIAIFTKMANLTKTVLLENWNHVSENRGSFYLWCSFIRHCTTSTWNFL